MFSNMAISGALALTGKTEAVTIQKPKCAGKMGVGKGWRFMGSNRNARSWPDPNLNNPEPGIVHRYVTIRFHGAATFCIHGA